MVWCTSLLHADIDLTIEDIAGMYSTIEDEPIPPVPAPLATADPSLSLLLQLFLSLQEGTTGTYKARQVLVQELYMLIFTKNNMCYLIK